MAKMLEINLIFGRYKSSPLLIGSFSNFLQSIPFHSLHFFSVCFTDQSSLPRTLCIYKKRDFSPPTRDSFFGESNHQTQTGNPGGQGNERLEYHLIPKRFFQTVAVNIKWSGEGRYTNIPFRGSSLSLFMLQKPAQVLPVTATWL